MAFFTINLFFAFNCILAGFSSLLYIFAPKESIEVTLLIFKKLEFWW